MGDTFRSVAAALPILHVPNDGLGGDSHVALACPFAMELRDLVNRANRVLLIATTREEHEFSFFRYCSNLLKLQELTPALHQVVSIMRANGVSFIAEETLKDPGTWGPDVYDLHCAVGQPSQSRVYRVHFFRDLSEHKTANSLHIASSSSLASDPRTKSRTISRLRVILTKNPAARWIGLTRIWGKRNSASTALENCASGTGTRRLRGQFTFAATREEAKESAHLDCEQFLSATEDWNNDRSASEDPIPDERSGSAYPITENTGVAIRAEVTILPLGYVDIACIPNSEGIVFPYISDAVIALPSYNQTKQNIHSRAMYSQELLQRRYELRGSHFSQQDGIISRCAHACIKMAMRNLAQIMPHQIRIPSYQQMNQMAGGEEASLSKPAKGLSAKDIAAILADSKIHCDIFSAESLIKSTQDPTHKLGSSLAGQITLKKTYYAIESGFPTILVFEGLDKDKKKIYHTLTIVGHVFDGNVWHGLITGQYTGNKREPYDYQYIPSHMWIDGLVVQDDNFGPYCNVSMRSLAWRNPVVIIPRFKWDIGPKRVDKKKRYNLPNDWTSGADEIEMLAYHQLVGSTWLEESSKPSTKLSYIEHVLASESITEHIKESVYFQRTVNCIKSQNVVLRTIPCTRKKFAEVMGIDSILEAKYIEGISKLLEDKPFWIVEVSIPHLYQRSLRRVGEIIFQERPRSSNQNRYGLIFIRFPGVLSIATEKGGLDHFEIEGRYHYPLVSLRSEELTTLHYAKVPN